MKGRSTPAYRVEIDSLCCTTCGHGASWNVVGPDEVATGTTYDDLDSAVDVARALSDAYAEGLAGAFAVVARRGGPEDRRSNGTNPERAPAGGERRMIPHGRRDFDDGIPF